MNAKNIAKTLHSKIDKWIESIEDKAVVKSIQENAIITGGAIVSLLNGQKPNDYDIYFKTLDSCDKIARYYAEKWNATKTTQVEIETDEERVRCFIKSVGIAAEEDEEGIDDETEPYATENEEKPTEENPAIEKPKYRPRYFTTNAISLSDGIQIVIRFWGSVDEIHKNYDFVHCTCSYDYKTNQVNLPSSALEAILNKELYYIGSKYPLCSIIRSRKFIQRGWNINAGQYLKMCLQLNELDLKDLKVFQDQLCGVDSAYFSQAIAAVEKKKEEEPDFKIDNNYLFEIINRIF